MEKREFYGVIYMAVNKVNNKAYVGQAVQHKGNKDKHLTLRNRIRKHIYYAKRGMPYSFQDAIRQYGEDNFIWTIISVCTSNHEELNELEIYYIAKFNTNLYRNNSWGYNETDGGKGQSGYKQKPETIEKRRQSNTGQVWSDERRQAMSELVKARPGLIQQLEKLWDKTRGSKHTDATRKQMSESHMGFVHSEESIVRMTKVQQELAYLKIGVKLSPEHVLKITEEVTKSARKRASEIGRKFKDESGIIYNTLWEASEKFGIPQSNLHHVLNGKRKRAKGHTFVYLDEVISG
jgi:group I intron endonuclease